MSSGSLTAPLVCMLPLLYGSLLFPSTNSRMISLKPHNKSLLWGCADVGLRVSTGMASRCGGRTGAGLCWSSVPPSAAVLQLLHVQPPGAQLQSQECCWWCFCWCLLCWYLLPSAPPPQPGVLLRFGGTWVEILPLIIFMGSPIVRDRHLQSTEMANLCSVISHLNSFGI